MKKLLERKDLDLEEMKERLNSQEKERQSELLQLQLEVSELVHRVSSGFCQNVLHITNFHQCEKEQRFHPWRPLLLIKLIIQ